MTRFRLSVSAAGLAVCVTLSGCVAVNTARRVANQNANRAPVKSEPALAQVQAGTSTREDLLATLGPTATLRLDSGYEVWAYKLPADKPDDPPKGEFVVLVAPSGKVTKTRLRLTPIAVQGKPVPPAEEDEGKP